VAGAAAVATPYSYFDAVKREYAARRDVLVSGLNRIKGVHCPSPGGAFYVLAQFPIDDSDRFCQWMLEHFDYENQTVMIAPATGFYSAAHAGKDQVRLAYVLNTDDLKKSLACIERGLAVYPGRR